MLADDGEAQVDVFDCVACHFLLLYFELLVNILDIVIQHRIRSDFFTLVMNLFELYFEHPFGVFQVNCILFGLD